MGHARPVGRVAVGRVARVDPAFVSDGRREGSEEKVKENPQVGSSRKKKEILEL